jgi:peroxiredoxin Q/BCP
MINVGDQAPAFSIPNQSSDSISLDSLSGRYVLIWWYPKADTPG